MPKVSQYDFPLNELAAVPNRRTAAQSTSISKSKILASEYIYSQYKFDVLSHYDDDNEDVWELYDSEGWYYVIKGMSDNLQTIRAYLLIKTAPEIKNDIITTFDLYVTSVFIEKFLEMKALYDSKCKQPTERLP